MTQARLISCLILTSYKEHVDKLKLIEVANTSFVSKMNIAFSFKNINFPTKFKVMQRGHKYQAKGVIY